jgi:hypothetical protein
LQNRIRADLDPEKDVGDRIKIQILGYKNSQTKNLFDGGNYYIVRIDKKAIFNKLDY